MKKEIKNHEDVYIHIKKRDWFKVWSASLWLILTVMYWVLIVYLFGIFCAGDVCTFMDGFKQGIGFALIYVMLLYVYLMAIVSKCEEKLGDD